MRELLAELQRFQRAVGDVRRALRELLVVLDGIKP